MWIFESAFRWTEILHLCGGGVGVVFIRGEVFTHKPAHKRTISRQTEQIHLHIKGLWAETPSGLRVRETPSGLHARRPADACQHWTKLPLIKNKSWSVWRQTSECTVRCISSPRREPQDRIQVEPYQRRVRPRPPRKNTPSALQTLRSPLHPFVEIFSGRNCAVLKQIYFNTRHNIWTNKEKSEHFYILLSRSKKRTSGFLSFAGSAFWLLAHDVRCIILPRGGADTFRWKWNVCGSRSFLCHWSGGCPVDSVYRKVFVLNMPM